MSPETRVFLDRVRDAEDPTAEDEERVLAAVRATVTLGVVTAALAATPQLWRWFTSWAMAGLKVGSVGVLFAVAAGPADAPVSEPLPAVAFHTPLARGRHSDIVGALVVPRTTAEPLPLPEASAPPAARAPRTVKNRSHGRGGPPSIRDEVALLARVQAARKRGDDAEALALLDGHATNDAQLSAERGIARILALCSLGRTDDARRAAADFQRLRPGSLHRAALEGSCAQPKPSEDR